MTLLKHVYIRSIESEVDFRSGEFGPVKYYRFKIKMGRFSNQRPTCQ